MADRHVVTKQRAPSIKSMIGRLELLLEVEETERGKCQLENALA